MAAGCPFTVTDVGGVRDIVTPDQAQFMVPEGDWQAMAHALLHLLTDDALRDRLTAEGRAHVQGYSQDKVLPEFVALVSP
jgi:glycosyltransferase involved in cell wall biosynthesis